MNTSFRVLKARLMLWKDVSHHDMEEIDGIKSIPDLESTLCRVFGVTLSEPKLGILMEMYIHVVLFCREQNFNREQTSSLLSIVKCIHEANVETQFNNIKECVTYCEELLLCHSVRRPPFSLNLFNSEEVMCVLKYIYNSYLRHCKLYKYVFAPEVKLDLSFIYIDERQPKVTLTGTDDEDTGEKDMYPDIPEEPIAEEDAATLELKALIENQVTEQMSRVSEQLNLRMKEIAQQHSDASPTSVSPAPQSKAKTKSKGKKKQ